MSQWHVTTLKFVRHNGGGRRTGGGRQIHLFYNSFSTREGVSLLKAPVTSCEQHTIWLLVSYEQHVVACLPVIQGIFRPHPHNAAGIWKRKFHSENAGKLGQGDHMTTVTSSFSKSSAFSNSPGLKSVFEKFRFADGLVWTVSQTVEVKLGFQNSSA